MSQSTIGSLLETSRISCDTTLSSKKKSLQYVAQLMEDSLNINEDDDDDEGVDMDVMDALAAREKLGCTGMGHGIAIPHGRVDFVSEPIGALLTLKEAVPFDAPDDVPVDIIFGLLIPVNQNEEHLNILASLASFFNSAENRNAIRDANDAEEILQILIDQDTSQSTENQPLKNQPSKTQATAIDAEHKPDNGTSHPDQ